MDKREEILNKNVGKLALSGLKWKSLADRRERIYEAMEEYASHLLAEKEARIKELEEGLRGMADRQPYPEDIWLPVSSDELKRVHDMLQKEFNMPLDRLSGHIGRILYNGVSAAAKQLLTHTPDQK